MHPRELVLRFLSGVGRRAEAEYYLSLFRAERRESFATIHVGEEALRDEAGALAVDLRFLARLDLSPVLTFPEEEHARDLERRLEPDVGARVVEPAEAADFARRGGLPLVPLAGASLEGLTLRLEARKVVFLVLSAGLARADGEIPSLVDLTTERDALMTPGVLAPEQARLLDRARALIERAPHPMTVAVTSPLDLLRELFTVRGAGTLIRRGAEVARASAWTEVDRARLSALMESAFGAPPRPALFSRAIESIYVADDYRGAAIVTPSPLGPYLTKFAVDVRAQGEGVGGDLWRALTRDTATLFWRSRPENPIVPWYVARCDGMQRAGAWHVFWRGLDPERVPRAIDHALSLEPDF